MQLEPGLRGYVATSEMSWSWPVSPFDLVDRGDEVDAVVLAVEARRGILCLGMKQLMPQSEVELGAIGENTR